MEVLNTKQALNITLCFEWRSAFLQKDSIFSGIRVLPMSSIDLSNACGSFSTNRSINSTGFSESRKLESAVIAARLRIVIAEPVATTVSSLRSLLSWPSTFNIATLYRMFAAFMNSCFNADEIKSASFTGKCKNRRHRRVLGNSLIDEFTNKVAIACSRFPQHSIFPDIGGASEEKEEKKERAKLRIGLSF